MSRLAKVRFREICDLLEEMGILTTADRDMIILYAELWGTLQEALMEKPRTIKPSTMDSISRRLQSIGADLGLSPVARQRIHVQPKAEDGDIPGVLD